MVVKAVIAYDGSRFDGFQVQKHTSNTIASKLNSALKSLGINSKIVASGRTDKGVHATRQVISFQLPYFWNDLSKLRTLLNNRLSPYILIKSLQQVPPSFHARFSAKRRGYRYLLSLSPFDPFKAGYVTFLKEKVDFKKIKEGLSLFEGKHDFYYFHKSGSDPKTTTREIYTTKLYFYQNLAVIYFEANGFLRSQVRMMVEALLEVGREKLLLSELKLQLEAKERFITTLAPPNGLYLCKVIY
ncbi:MAG: tRNA pseudouridine(38-40) synthase TruA [Epsilonproteobacteria bacterium]|nr:tRNA pseudouridine(38-40) synthase TruA [Campylobacterota bacterium]